MKKATAVTVPPGEDGIELQGGEAIAALRGHLARQQHNTAPRIPLTLVNVDVWREGAVVIVKVAFGKVGEVTIRLSMFWARILHSRLSKALGK
jgi:hypothetical protein